MGRLRLLLSWSRLQDLLPSPPLLWAGTPVLILLLTFLCVMGGRVLVLQLPLLVVLPPAVRSTTSSLQCTVTFSKRLSNCKLACTKEKVVAGIQSATSRQNTKGQVYAQNEMLAYQQKESTARVASIMENTNLSKQQQVSEIMRQMLTQAQTAGQYFTNDQIKEMTRKVSAEVDLVHQQTQNQRYGSSHIGATAKDISNVVTDAASGVVDIFHGIDKAVADTWNNFWKDGNADGIDSNLSRK